MYVAEGASGTDQWVTRAVGRLREGMLAGAALGGADGATLQQEAASVDERYDPVRRLHFPFVADENGEFRPVSQVLFERYEAESAMDPEAMAQEVMRRTMAGDRQAVEQLLERMRGGDADHWAEYLAEAEENGFRTRILIDWR